MSKDFIRNYILNSIEVKQKVFSDNIIIDKISEISETIVKYINTGSKIFFAGNGGSYADAQHVVAEFVGRFKLNREPIPALLLGNNPSSLTAISNDISFSKIMFLYNEHYSSHLQDSLLFNGVFFMIDSTLQYNLKPVGNVNHYRCVLFDASFSGDFQQLKNVDYKIEINTQANSDTRFLLVNKLIKICDHLIKTYDMNVFLCQKVYIFKDNLISLRTK